MRAVVFDLDGTLIDSAPDIHAAVNRMLAEVGAELAQLAAETGVDLLYEAAVAGAIPLVRALRESLTGERIHRVMGIVNGTTNFTRLYPNVRETLQALAAAGWAIGLCTNKPVGPSHEILAAFGIDGLFRAVVGGDSLAEKKPDPAPLLHAAAALGRARTAYVGDSEVDAETAHRAALPFALFTHGYRKTPVADLHHDALFDDFAALPAILEALLP